MRVSSGLAYRASMTRQDTGLFAVEAVLKKEPLVRPRGGGAGAAAECAALLIARGL